MLHNPKRQFRIKGDLMNLKKIIKMIKINKYYYKQNKKNTLKIKYYWI